LASFANFSFRQLLKFIWLRLANGLYLFLTRELEADAIAVVSMAASVSTGCNAGARPRLQVPRDIAGFGVLRGQQFLATLLTFVNFGARQD
jgi:hypothetical protein